MYWSEKVCIVQFILFLLTQVTRCIGHALPSTNHLKCWCQNWFVQNRNLKAYGVCHVSEQIMLMKRHSLAFLLSLLSCLILVISTQHHYSAQIDYDMHEFKLFRFSLVMHWDMIMCLVLNERRENLLDNEAYSLIKSCVAMTISYW